jgi:hypothetical protein
LALQNASRDDNKVALIQGQVAILVVPFKEHPELIYVFTNAEIVNTVTVEDTNRRLDVNIK